MILTETQLESFSACSLRGVPAVLPVRQAAERTLTWAMRESYLSDVPSLKDMREYFADAWALLQPRNRNKEEAYWDGLRCGPSVAKRIRDLIMSHEIRQPVTPYNLVLEGQTINGAYALLKGATRHSSLLVLNTVMVRPKYWQMPNLPALARWTDARRNSLQERDILVLNLPLFKGKPWKQEVVDERRALKWLGNAVRQVNLGLEYPVASVACERCVGRPCRKVFQI